MMASEPRRAFPALATLYRVGAAVQPVGDAVLHWFRRLLAAGPGGGKPALTSGMSNLFLGGIVTDLTGESIAQVKGKARKLRSIRVGESEEIYMLLTPNGIKASSSKSKANLITAKGELRLPLKAPTALPKGGIGAGCDNGSIVLRVRRLRG